MMIMQENKNIVSIIVPIYNAENFLNRCLDSIVNQTYNNLEIILINDGSADNSLKIMQNYRDIDQRIKCISQENKGVSATRNVGLKHAAGDFILFIDADDWIELNMVEKMLNLFESKTDIDIVFCSSDNAENQNDVIKVENLEVEIWDNNTQIKEFLMHKKMTGMLWNKLIRRKLFDNILFDEEVGYGEDAQALWKVIKKTRCMAVTNEKLYHHVIEISSISHQGYSEVKFSAIKVWEEIKADVVRDFSTYLCLVNVRLATSAILRLRESRLNNNIDIKSKKYLKTKVREFYVDLMKSKSTSVKMKLYATFIIISRFVCNK